MRFPGLYHWRTVPLVDDLVDVYVAQPPRDTRDTDQPVPVGGVVRGAVRLRMSQENVVKSAVVYPADAEPVHGVGQPVAVAMIGWRVEPKWIDLRCQHGPVFE